MAQELTDFLCEKAEAQFEWGVDDCSLMIADWWRVRHGVDPASHLRGTYSTEAEKIKVVTDAGGLVSLVSSIADRVGAARTAAPMDGDFAVVRVRGRAYCAIRAGGFWAIRGGDGVAFVSEARVVRAWAI